MSQIFNSFSINTGNTSINSFLESNSLVSRFAFLLLVIFGFILLLRFGIMLVEYFYKPPTSPKLFTGMVDGSQEQTFVQDPNSEIPKTIYRSNNANDGIEFTWSSWLLFRGVGDSSSKYQHIFSKGNRVMDSTNMVTPNNAPGVYLTPKKNELTVIMDTYNAADNPITVPNIPMNKWINLIIRCQNTTIDIYINGIIARSIELDDVPKQNYGDVYVGLGGGFDGNISNLWYYDYALGTAAIQKLADNGPNTKLLDDPANSSYNSSYDYLSMSWYFNGF